MKSNRALLVGVAMAALVLCAAAVAEPTDGWFSVKLYTGYSAKFPAKPKVETHKDSGGVTASLQDRGFSFYAGTGRFNGDTKVAEKNVKERVAYKSRPEDVREGSYIKSRRIAKGSVVGFQTYRYHQNRLIGEEIWVADGRTSIQMTISTSKSQLNEGVARSFFNSVVFPSGVRGSQLGIK